MKVSPAICLRSCFWLPKLTPPRGSGHC
uniref:Uncharacterized protein n=1 Tax=Rhizophora mucronata TaxID=61149 RepID=A0A2P2NUN0_RHIMU